MFYAIFNSFVLLLSISRFSLTVLVSTDVSTGTWRVIRWLICVLPGGRVRVRRVWNMPPDTHCYILPLLCECRPVYDGVCRRSMNFLGTCISHSSEVVRCVANYGIFARTLWLSCWPECIIVWIDIALRCLMFCLRSLRALSIDLLRECMMIRDNVFTLPDFYTVADVQSIILYICSLG